VGASQTSDFLSGVKDLYRIQSKQQGMVSSFRDIIAFSTKLEKQKDLR
jgi:hypothetical protein